MKLYATMTSERDSRPAKKGGASKLDIQLFNGNAHVFTIKYKENVLFIQKWKQYNMNVIDETKATT